MKLYPSKQITKTVLRCLFTCSLGIVVLCFITSRSQAQQRPDRGFRSANSYSISDIETVNVTNGNMMMNIPLASLPAGRGTSPGYTVALRYNSKLWNVFREHRGDGTGEGLEGLRYTRDLIQQEGGWALDSGGYQLSLVNRFEILEPEVSCFLGEEAYRRNGYRFMLEMYLPDGSVTKFRPRNFSDAYNDGFFNLDPWGVKHDYMYLPPSDPSNGPSCSDSHVIVQTSGIHYDTDDGSRLRLFIPYQPGVHVSQMRWTLSYPDGRVIENLPADDPSIVLRLTDRNGNRVVWKGAVLNGEGGLKIENDVGHFIFVTGTATQYKIIQPGVGGELLETLIDWKSVWVYHNYQATNSHLAPTHALTAELFASLFVVDKITLPSQAGGLQYKFTYFASDTQPAHGNFTDGWGQLASITLPSGAKADYSFFLGGNSPFMEASQAANDAVMARVLTYDRQYDGTTETVSETTGYGGAVCTDDGRCWSQASLPSGTLKGYPYRVIHTGGLIDEKLWVDLRPTGGIGSFKIEPFVKTEYRSVPDKNGNPVFTAIKDYEYDQNGNLLEVKEYDWVPYSSIPRTTLGPFSETLIFPKPTGLPSGLNLKRRTINTYYNPTPNALSPGQNHFNHHSNPTAPKLLHLIKSTEVRDGSGQVFSRSEFYYDGGLASPNRGNLTETRVWDSSKGAFTSSLSAGNSISIFSEYDQYGNVTESTDANGNLTLITYGDVVGPNGLVNGLYPTQIVAAYGTAVARTSAAIYDFHTGLVTTSTDVDNNVSAMTTYDAVGRPTLVRAARDTLDETQTSTQYFDSERRVVVRQDLEIKGDGKLVSIQHFDQLGRVRLSRQLEGFSAAGLSDETIGIKVQTRYRMNNPCQATIHFAQCYVDNKATIGSFVITSNPYRAATSGAASSESTMGWSRTHNDHTGRLVDSQTFAGSALPAPWGTTSASTGIVITEYDAEFTTVTDQAGRVRRSRFDGLNRLVRVDEPDNNFDLGPVNNPKQSTVYTYDPLGNLSFVTQGAQTRTFQYTSISRLREATNPESGTVNYEYDFNGNLKKKSHARLLSDNITRITTTFVYDELNRVKTRSYNDGTPNVTYAYDDGDVLNSRGRLTSVSSSVSSYSLDEYDVLGRAKRATQTTDEQDYLMSYEYNLAGGLVSQKYPSGRIVKTEYDNAGRVAGIRNNSNGPYYAGAAGTDVTNRIQYSAAGAIQAIKLGNGLWEHTNFNSRLQAIQIGLGTTSTNSTILNLDYGYGTTNNNGNVQSQTITVPTVGSVTGFMATQNYTYDSLNRLETAQENNGSSWRQNFSYDRYGNRKLIAGTTLPATLTGANNPIINPNNNRIDSAAAGQGNILYDNAGNLTREVGGHTYQYDGEDKMVKYDGGASSGGGATYTYDGDGRRVKKVVGGSPIVTTVFVYDINGQLIAEYSDSAPSGAGTSFITSDTLGSPRVITNASQQIKGRHDYLPFGEELFTGTGGRTSQQNFGADNLRQKFTSKERDIETGLDYFGVRYYGSLQGRFLSPDPLNPMLSASNDTQGEAFFLRYIAEPANWNKYAYVYNNPLRRIDPDGRFPQDLVTKNLTFTITKYARTTQIAQQLAIKLVKYTFDWVFGSTPEVRPGALQQHEVDFAKQVSQFTQFTFVGMPTKNEPGIDGILTGSGGLTDVRGVASLTETDRSNPRVLIDLAEAKEASAKNGGYMQVDLFIKANALDSATVTEYINRGPAITTVASGDTIRSISIFTNDNKVVRVEGQKVTTCDQSGSCQ